jgi:hypothetical protein
MTDHSLSIAERLHWLNERIAAAQRRAASPAPVTLVAVSKKQPAAAVRAAAEAGQRVFGENYAQEGIAKQHELGELDLVWHHIGPIQSNKCADIAAHFDWAQGVDRAKIARRLGAARGAAQAPLQVCVQVNISNEASKSGVAPEEVEALCEVVSAQAGLQLRGLMAIPAPPAGGAPPQAEFERLRALYERLRAAGWPLDTLSMGMSADFETAIACGATMVRVGSSLFGPRA